MLTIHVFGKYSRSCSLKVGEKRLSEPIGGNNAGAEVWKLCKNLKITQSEWVGSTVDRAYLSCHKLANLESCMLFWLLHFSTVNWGSVTLLRIMWYNTVNENERNANQIWCATHKCSIYINEQIGFCTPTKTTSVSTLILCLLSAKWYHTTYHVGVRV